MDKTVTKFVTYNSLRVFLARVLPHGLQGRPLAHICDDKSLDRAVIRTEYPVGLGYTGFCMEYHHAAMVCRYKTVSDPPVYRVVIAVSLAVCLLTDSIFRYIVLSNSCAPTSCSSTP